jgi:hypothetical protein
LRRHWNITLKHVNVYIYYVIYTYIHILIIIMSLQIFTVCISWYGSGSHQCRAHKCSTAHLCPPPSLHHGTKVRNWAPGRAPQCVCYGCYGTTARAWGMEQKSKAEIAMSCGVVADIFLTS